MARTANGSAAKSTRRIRLFMMKKRDKALTAFPDGA
jgi:hypothetical protein